jgi:hypothetical protein
MIYGGLNMKIQNRIFIICLTALLIVSIVNISPYNNLSDVNESHENETNVTEVGIEAYVTPVNTTIVPVTPLETTTEPTIPVSTPNKSPGFGIVVAIVVVLSAMLMNRHRKPKN